MFFIVVTGFTRSRRMKAVIVFIAIFAAVAQSSVSTPNPVPTILEEATPVDMLLYLYDVVLTSHMSREANNQGTQVFINTDCPGGVPRLKSGRCPYVTTSQPDYSDLLY